MDEGNVRSAKMALQRYKTLDAAKTGLRRDAPTRHPTSAEWKEAKRLLTIDQKELAAAMKARYGNPGEPQFMKCTGVRIKNGKLEIRK